MEDLHLSRTCPPAGSGILSVCSVLPIPTQGSTKRAHVQVVGAGLVEAAAGPGKVARRPVHASAAPRTPQPQLKLMLPPQLLTGRYVKHQFSTPWLIVN